MRTNQDDRDQESGRQGRFHGYLRVSTREQAGDDRQSLNDQEREIRELASSRCPEWELILWPDPGQSAWSIPLGRRKAGKEMLEMLRPGDIIVATKFDRLFRSMRDAHNQIADLQTKGVELIILQFGREPIGATPMGKAMVSIFALLAELEADFTRQRTGDGRAAKRARGGFAGGGVPMGWEKIGKGREAYLVEDEREQAMLKEACELRVAGKTFAWIAAELTERGYRNRAGKPIIASQVYQWIERARDRKPKGNRSERIREALAKRKARGLSLGNPQIHDAALLGTAAIKARSAAHREEVMPVVEEICAADPLHVTLQSVSDELERRGVPTARGGQWHPATVRDLLKRAGKSLSDVRRRSADIVTPLQDRVFSHERDTVGLSQQSIAHSLVIRELKQKLPELFVLKHQGWSYRKLAREYGYERRTLVRQFEKQRKIWAEMSPPAKREAIIALANAGMSRQGIMEELHVSQRTLYRYLPTSCRTSLCCEGDLKPPAGGVVVPSMTGGQCDTREASPRACNDKPGDHHSTKRHDGPLCRNSSKREPTQLILAFDQLGEDDGT
jgi:DNA invertase Pin-like site-specific DNA recombinase